MMQITEINKISKIARLFGAFQLIHIIFRTFSKTFLGSGKFIKNSSQMEFF